MGVPELEEMPRPTRARRLSRTLAPWLVLAVILAGTLALRWRLVEIPLERDEGEYAYAGQLMLRGHPPYQLAYNMKMPGIYVGYAAILAVFGQTHQGIHYGLLVINSATILMVFLLARRLFDIPTALLAAAAFALHSMVQSVLGFTANAEQFVVLPATAGVWALLWALDSGRWSAFVLSGLLFGIAFLMKQHGMFFGFFAGTYLILQTRPPGGRAWGRCLARCAVLAAAALIPFAVVCVWLKQVGVFDTFWFWVFDYAATYVSSIPPYIGLLWLPESWLDVAKPCFGLWALVLIGLDATIQRDPAAHGRRRFLLLFGLFSFFAVCPGFYFREHYFVLLLPAMALFAAVGARALARWLAALATTGPEGSAWRRELRFLLICAFALGTPLFTERDYFFRATTNQIARGSYSGNPVVEALWLAEYLKARTTPADTIAILGSEPQIYFYADRRSATGHIYTYALMENQPYALRMQQEMIAEIEAARPTYMLYVNIQPSWVERDESERMIFAWWAEYQRHYELVAVLEMGARWPGNFYFDDQARRFPLEKNVLWVTVMKRRAGS